MWHDNRWIEILQGARARIADPDRWSQGPEGLTPDRMCAGLALEASLRESRLETTVAERCRIRGLIMGIPYSDGLMWWNDSHTHAEVLAGFDRAIAKLEGQA